MRKEMLGDTEVHAPTWSSFMGDEHFLLAALETKPHDTTVSKWFLRRPPAQAQISAGSETLKWAEYVSKTCLYEVHFGHLDGFKHSIQSSSSIAVATCSLAMQSFLITTKTQELLSPLGVLWDRAVQTFAVHE